VPDGTLYTINTLGEFSDDPYGTVVTADADGTRDGIQVAAIGGHISFDVQFSAPGAYLPGRVLVYATDGTALGQLVLRKTP
jgi:hypothetical protein